MGFEIEKLRSRLKNVKKGVTEYRMTVTEAQKLIEEYDNEKKATPVVKTPEPEVVRTNILDGGGF